MTQDEERRSFVSSESDKSQLYYERPGRIINSGLIDSGTKKGLPPQLRENLCEHYDFEALFPSVWKHFYSWYSADIQVVRHFKRDVLNKNQFALDLYPH
jgi:hypothetical protein